MTDPEAGRQSAEGKGIAQADRGGKAEVNVFHGVPAERVAELLLDAKRKQTEAVPIIHLPQRKAIFIGRETEIETLRRQLQEPGSLAYVSGVAGNGKTALALEYAHRYKADFESVHWLGCQRRSLVQIAGELAFQLDLKLEGEADTIVRELNGHCGRKRCLLVFDNVDDEAPARLLPGGRTSVLITTLHHNLRFLRSYQPIKLPLFTEEQCFELFRNKVGKDEVDKNEAEGRSLFKRLGYLPIGISVAAGLVREDVRYTIESMARNLPEDAYAFLKEAVATLSPTTRTLLAAMAVCAPEGFRLSLAAEIAGLNEALALDALQEIHSRSLDEELDRSMRRYRLHALVREAAGANDVQRRKHAEAIRKQFERWETDWHNCEKDMADWQTTFGWLLCQTGDEAWAVCRELTLTGYRLTYRLGRVPEAYEICERMLQAASTKEDMGALQAWYGNKASILRNWGRLDEAMQLLKKQEALCLELGDEDGLQDSYGKQASTLRYWGRLNEAIALHYQKEAICLRLGDQDGLQHSYGHRALILKAWGRLEEAMALLCKQETVCRAIGNQDGLQRNYGNRGLILKAWARLEEAMALFKEQEAISMALGNQDSLQRSFGNQAMVLKDWGKLEEGRALLAKQEAICLDIGNSRSLAYCYWNWALLARKQRDGNLQREKLQHALALFTELKMPREIKAVRKELDKANANDRVS